jgi:hypothetical protein
MALSPSVRSVVNLVQPSISGYAVALFRPEEIAKLEIFDKKGVPYAISFGKAELPLKRIWTVAAKDA